MQTATQIKIKITMEMVKTSFRQKVLLEQSKGAFFIPI